jgi:hypothetical protein
MKEKFINSMKWSEEHWLSIVILMLLILFFALLAVLYSWIYGYWSNGLKGTKFDLNSCWSGVTVIAAGLGSVAALSVPAWAKYSTDSKFNSPAGVKPYSNIVKGNNNKST